MPSVIANKMQSSMAQEETENTIGQVHEFIALCPKCKTMETLRFTGDRLVQTRKFSHQERGVFHDCGSEEPCRLLPTIVGPDSHPDVV
ncbi:MAG: hypothetical protein ACOC6S_02415 [Chloroflexota bacterium]